MKVNKKKKKKMKLSGTWSVKFEPNFTPTGNGYYFKIYWN